MASFDTVSLAGVRGRIVAQQFKKQAGVRSKFSGQIGPAVVPLSIPGPGFPGPGGPFPAPRLPPPPPRLPLVPTLPTLPTLPDLGAKGCELLTGTARDICLFGLRFVPQGTPSTGCPAGMVKLGDTCVDLTALPPGGDPAFTPTTAFEGGQATVGAFGLPALAPTGISRIVRKCGRGMVLGVDNLCYPKAVLTGRSKFRKWRQPVRPPISRRDVVAIRRAASARDRVLELAKDVGLSLSKSKKRAPRKKSAASAHHER